MGSGGAPRSWDSPIDTVPLLVHRSSLLRLARSLRSAAPKSRSLSAGDNHSVQAAFDVPGPPLQTTLEAVTKRRRRPPSESREFGCGRQGPSGPATESILATLEDIHREGIEICAMLTGALVQYVPSPLARRGWAGPVVWKLVLDCSRSTCCAPSGALPALGR